MDIEDFANLSPQTSSLRGLDSCLSEVDIPSPIDFYMIKSRECVKYGTQKRLNEFSSLGGLLLLGLVSTAEGYFRSLLSACLEICPDSKKHASEKSINLGGVLWHGSKEFRRSAFEHMSFTSKKELESAAKTYIDLNLQGSQFSKLLIDYDQICHVRHGLVHNSGILPGRNATHMDIKKYTGAVNIEIDFAYLQSAGASIDSLIATFNRVFFREMCSRWAVSWRRRADWDPKEEKRRFMQIWKLFLCRIELSEREGKSKIKPSLCMEALRLEYGL